MPPTGPTPRCYAESVPHWEVLTRLYCQKIALLVSAFVLGCGEPLSPDTVAAGYVLETVNGQPLPVVLSPIPEESISVIGGSVTLTKAQRAITLERRRELHANVPTEEWYISNFTFTLDGNAITLYPECPPNALCGTLDGVLSGEALSLTYGRYSNAPLVYTYRKLTEP